jgi:hypothetical protein
MTSMAQRNTMASNWHSLLRGAHLWSLNMLPAVAVSLMLAACGGGGGGGNPPEGCTTCEFIAYVGDDVGDYTYKYTSVRTGALPSVIDPHYGYREPTCQYLASDRDDFLNHGGRNVVLASYLGTSLNPAHKGDAAWGVYAYRETYDFKAIDQTHMSFTHKISIYEDSSFSCNETASGNKKGEITRTGENTNKASPTNPLIFSNSGTPGGQWWTYFLVQRTGTSLFTWTGKTTLPTGESVDMFEVDLPELTNRSWSFQAWSADSNKTGGVNLGNPLFNGKNKFKALVYMQRYPNDKAYPWGYSSIKIIMDPTNYMTTTPLSQWQSFEYFNPKLEPYNMYDLPTQ